MSGSRRLQALRNLAERPGTEAEGRVAAAMLAKLTKQGKPTERQLRARRDVEWLEGCMSKLSRTNPDDCLAWSRMRIALHLFRAEAGLDDTTRKN